MSLEIKGSAIFVGNKQLCGGCFELVRSANVVENGPIMVGPMTETAKRTGWGGSNFLGRVITPSSHAFGISDKKGRIHLAVPIAVETLSIAGRAVKVQATYAIAHDLKALP